MSSSQAVQELHSVMHLGSDTALRQSIGSVQNKHATLVDLHLHPRSPGCRSLHSARCFEISNRENSPGDLQRIGVRPAKRHVEDAIQHSHLHDGERLVGGSGAEHDRSGWRRWVRGQLAGEHPVEAANGLDTFWMHIPQQAVQLRGDLRVVCVILELRVHHKAQRRRAPPRLACAALHVAEAVEEAPPGAAVLGLRHGRMHRGARSRRGGLQQRRVPWAEKVHLALLTASGHPQVRPQETCPAGVLVQLDVAALDPAHP
mmetsp:Transcript_52774/g.140267  ORF Transcript_52774/g.140267 Transcript_52774/m.140267 type:complete len:259 (-) Transcript_52774:1254-2030(-)